MGDGPMTTAGTPKEGLRRLSSPRRSDCTTMVHCVAGECSNAFPPPNGTGGCHPLGAFPALDTWNGRSNRV